MKTSTNNAQAANVTFQKTSIKDDRGFSNALTKARTGIQTAFALVQDCVLYGLEKYEKHSADASYLSRAMELCIQVPGTNPNQVKAYIQEHANVQWRKAGDGTTKFGKSGKGPATVTMPEEGYNWWDQKSESIIVRADMVDPVAEIIKLMDRMKTKEAAGKMPESRKQLFHELQQQLAPVLAMEKLPTAQLFSAPDSNTPPADAEKAE